jgi:hypothetical protein
MVPMVGTADEAARIVACTRYPPMGRRGAAFGFAHDDYEGGEVTAKIAALNARTMVIPQIETREGLANVEAIAAVPGVDALWVGHFDLTNFMGIPGQFRHPDFLEAIARIVARCEAHGKTAAVLATDDDWARDYAAKGFRLMGYGVDQAMLQRALGNGLDVLRAGDAPRKGAGDDEAVDETEGRPHTRHPRFARRAGVRRRRTGHPRSRARDRMGISARGGVGDHRRPRGALRRALREPAARSCRRGRARRLPARRRRAAMASATTPSMSPR